MCVLALAWRAHPRWRLVLMANRDELHSRPSAALGRWEDAPSLLAGRDLVSGGTWLGVSDQARMCVVTNLHTGQAPDPDAPSRGRLVSDLLSRTESGHPRPDETHDFAPFNLISLADTQLVFSTNRPEPRSQALPAGLYGLSNASLDTPWPKTRRLKTALSSWLASDRHEVGDLLIPLTDEEGLAPPPAETSPVFIRAPYYGTRCSTALVVDADGQGLMIERRFDSHGRISGQTEKTFEWPASAL